MFLEIVRSEGLAHLSYVLGDAGRAAVIDPRRDIEAYLDIADRHGARITHVFETHRNEDYVIGSSELARRMDVEIRHGHAFDFGYGEPAREGDEFEFGSAKLRVLETPGHTDESISLALYDTESGDSAVAVFTGDALFIGDVGRTDFYPDRAEEVAGALYDSIFEKLLPLGDQTILYPAHGAGSVCGSEMASRELSTLGYERRHNPRLQLSRDDFVRHKTSERHDKPPYFKRMEELNAKGAEPRLVLPHAEPLDADAFAAAVEAGAIALDVRNPEALAGALIPGSIGIPLEMLPAYAGFYLPYDRDIVLVVHGSEEVETAVRFLFRLGFDSVVGYLDEGLHAWATSGRPYQTIPAVHADRLAERIESGADYTLLDVRSPEEFESGHLTGATHIPIGEVASRIEEVPDPRPVTTFCGSGQRAVIASTLLLREGIEDVEVCLGSMAACSAVGCPIE